MTDHEEPSPDVDRNEQPVGDARGLVRHFRYDILSGFLVFLIALPLCLGIALACGYPAIAGIFTAIIGAVLTTFISNSELTIKGPAAGLIVIAIGAITQMGELYGEERAYRLALGIGVAAGVLQMIFAVFRAGILAEFFPLSAVHGMLASIGVIIIIKQVPVAVGQTNAGEPLELLLELPDKVMHMNPAIALIGGVSLLIMFLWPVVKKTHKVLAVIPAPMIVLLTAVPLSIYFNLTEAHMYFWGGHEYELNPGFLVEMPDRVFGMFDDITLPDFAGLTTMEDWKLLAGWKWVLYFAIIGALESVLSAKAVDMIDPWKRKTTLDRDLLAVGVGNTLSATVGGLPMISEIVRSRANIDNGARTRFADMWHGMFLLVCVALIPTILHLIPLAALAAMLIYTGFRLAHPTEFVHAYRIGKEQLVIFVATIVAVLATDLLVGIAIGIGVKLLIHLINGVPIRSVFKPYLNVEKKGEDTVMVFARYSAIFSNWILFRRQLVTLGLRERKNIVLDLSQTKLVDHTVMEKLHDMQLDFEQAGLRLDVVGLDDHRQLSQHSLAARKKTS